MCYRMRAVACAPDFEQAMAFEEHLDKERRPALASRAMMPALPELLASMSALEGLRQLTNMHPAALADGVLEYDAMSNATTLHPVLTVPDCPVCSTNLGRTQPQLDDLVRSPPTAVDIQKVARKLVDARTGIVSHLSAVARDPSEVPLPLVWRAQLANHRFVPTYSEDRATSSGKGMTRTESWASCLGEATERYAGGHWTPEELVVARRADLEGASLDPRELVLYAESQYGSLPYVPYREDLELAWVRARSLISGDEVWVPAIAVFMDYSATPEEYLCPITSNGLASGPTLQEAVLRALSEVLERDAVLLTWLNRLPGHPHEALRHPDDDVRRLAKLYRRRGVDLELIEVATDNPMSVFLGIARTQRGVEGPAAVVGLGADIDPVLAARKAALEVGQVRPSIRRRARDVGETRLAELAADPLQVGSLEDHALFYAHQSTATAFDFLFGEPRPWTPQEPVPASDVLLRVVEHARLVAQDVLYVNLTPVDLASVGIFTARVIVPGFQPIWFGHREPRLGGTRLFDFPVANGFRTAAPTIAELNPMPHPIA
jgi:thiazole/oxazole-forming peptide maturase SagD family component